jgi:hypothetical protein
MRAAMTLVSSPGSYVGQVGNLQRVGNPLGRVKIKVRRSPKLPLFLGTGY